MHHAPHFNPPLRKGRSLETTRKIMGVEGASSGSLPAIVLPLF